MTSRWNLCEIGWYCVSSSGSNSPKTTQKGAWIDIFRPNSQNIKTGILSKPLHQYQPNFAQWQRPTNALRVVGPNTRKINRKWRTAAILKNRWSAISPQKFDRSAQNVAQRRILAFAIGPVGIISTFWKIQDGGRRHLKKLKNGHDSATVRPIGTKFGLVTHIGPPNRTGC